MDTVVTICGNTTSAPELVYGASGTARCSFTVAVNSREKQQDGSWGDGPATFYRCTAWRQLAENLAESCGDEKSTRLVVHGRLKGREFETSSGEKRLSLDVDVEYVGPDLRFQTARVSKVSRSGGSGGGFGQQRSAPADDGYSDPLGSAPPAGPPAGDDEPPF